jgi:SpoVK/Ycf46/Vps4 family AAA+-type ATPase
MATRSHKQDQLQASALDMVNVLPAVTDGYPDAHAHLLDELRWLNRLLAAHVLRLRRVNFYEGVKDFRGFFVAEDEIDALLAAGIFENDGKLNDEARDRQMAQLLTQAQSLRQDIARRVHGALAQKVGLPLARLARAFHLSELEMQALMICLAPQIDARYEKLYAYLQNDLTKKSPSVELILGLLCRSVEERLQHLSYLHPAAPLRAYRLLESSESGSATWAASPSAAQQLLRVDSRIVHDVLGNQTADERVRPYLHLVLPLDWKEVVISESLQSRLQKLLPMLLDKAIDSRPILYLHGRPGVGKKTVARALCGEADAALAVVDIRSLLRAPETFSEQVRLILREGLLQPCGVYFDHLEKLESSDDENALLFATLLREIRELGWLTFLGSANPLPDELLDLATIYAVEIPAPDYAGQKALWEIYLNGAVANEEAVHLDELAAHFNLTGGQIARAVRRAERSALVRDTENGHVTLADLFASSCAQSKPKLSTLARKIAPFYTWDDIVLPDDTMAQLREVCQRVRHRHRVLAEWGFDRKLSQGKGVNALFAGPSGTGKTMAAEIVANELGLDLYKIDLSGVVSKYIGETEKNLDHIFTAAEHANAILFFDEADALFGKRSEVRDSHDRYANIEISYLLQKMEQYEGLAILATNLRGNLDEAFVRRLAFTVHFPFPDEASRRRIWQGIWPAATPRAHDVDFNMLASQFKLSGGNIKNIALASAFLAAEDGGLVTMAHLIQATRREFQKMGKVMSESELGQYGARVTCNL